VPSLTVSKNCAVISDYLQYFMIFPGVLTWPDFTQ